MSTDKTVIQVDFGSGVRLRVGNKVITPVQFPANLSHQQSTEGEYGGTVNDRAACVRLSELLTELRLEVDVTELEGFRVVVKDYPNEQLFEWIAGMQESDVKIRPAFYIALLAEACDRPIIDR